MRSVVIVVVAALAVALSAPAFAKVLVYCSEASPEGFDPALFVTGATFDASSQVIYNRLVEYEHGTAKVVPGLAQSWDVSDDGLTYTFHLRQGVRFHSTPHFTPGRDLNAADVVFSLARQSDPKNPYFDYAGGQWPYQTGMSFDLLVKSIKKVDDATVQIVLAYPDASFLSTLAMDFASILSKEYADALVKAKTRELLNEQPIGTGPYEFIAYAPDARVGYKANPDYWRGAPKIDLLIFSITPDPAVRLKRLQAGECQVMADPDPATLHAAAGDDALEIAEADRLDVAYLAFNTTRPPFGDVRVRKALGLAIDKQAIVDAVYGGAASAANSLMPPSMSAYDGSFADGAHNVEAAKQLLADAGVSNLKIKLITTKLPRPYNPDPLRVANMIAADFAKVGVAASVVVIDQLGEFLRQSADKDRDGAALIGWTSDNGDADNFLSLLLSCDAVGASNRAEWCFAPFDDLVARAKATRNPAERAAIYKDVQEILNVHQPLTAIAHTVVSVPMAKAVTGYAASPFGLHNFEGVDIAP